MPVPTSRTKENGRIILHTENCTGCGLCVEVCKDFSLILQDNKVRLAADPAFGCIACGHCMAICPEGAIEISGRTLSASDLFDLSAFGSLPEYDQMMNLLRHRRSIREFRDRPVEKAMIEQILEAARQAPMGLPPSDVNVLILENKEAGRSFAADFCGYLEKISWWVSPWFLALMRPFWGKANDELFKGFIRPMIRIFTRSMKQGVNHVTYDAPLTMYFYGSPWCDPADPLIAATYAMLAGESLGLGTCMIGSIHPMIQNGGAAKKFRDKYKIRFKSREGLVVIFGHPAVKYPKGIRRTFASETFIRN